MEAVEIELDGQVISVDHRIPRQDLERYTRFWGLWCRKCRRRWKLSAILLTPECEWGDSVPLSEFMIVCSGCRQEINDRLKLKLEEDLGPSGTVSARSRKFAAAWNAPAHWYEPNHPANKTRAGSSLVSAEGTRRSDKKKPKRQKSTLLGTTKRLSS